MIWAVRLWCVPIALFFTGGAIYNALIGEWVNVAITSSAVIFQCFMAVRMTRRHNQIKRQERRDRIYILERDVLDGWQ